MTLRQAQQPGPVFTVQNSEHLAHHIHLFDLTHLKLTYGTSTVKRFPKATLSPH